jgi:hypothetical protein
MRDHIERLRAKPEHIRKRIAIGTSVGVTAVVALVWLTTLVTSGTLALNLVSPGGNIAEGGSGNVQGAVAETQTNFSQLLGAVGAISSSSTDPNLIIVDQAPTTTPANSNPTVIPF